MSNLNHTASARIIRKANVQLQQIGLDGGYVTEGRGDALALLLAQSVDHIEQLETELATIKANLSKAASLMSRMAH